MKGKLTVIGLGPGGPQGITLEAQAALEEAQLICGYTGYIDLIRERFGDKELLYSPMTQEIARCRAALEAASQGRQVAMVCSGDPGVYGMASPILELAKEFPQVEVIILPGVTAAASGAALLGAPLTHDFAVISLSDRLTPWETIEKRLRLAAKGDFVLCLYNPVSRSRPDYLSRACRILLEELPGERLCGWTRNIGREGESWKTLTLQELEQETDLDMFTTVFIGNSTTRMEGGRLITPRGYGISR